MNPVLAGLHQVAPKVTFLVLVELFRTKLHVSHQALSIVQGWKRRATMP